MSMTRRAVEVSKKVVNLTPYQIRKRRDAAQSFFEETRRLRSLIDLNSSPPFVRTFVQNLVGLPNKSCAQIAQDYFALAVAKNKRDGYFVEFGAADGVDCSNSYLLEKEFGWNGVVAEPNQAFLPNIKAHRQCAIEQDCVWARTGESLPFLAADEGTLSTISTFATGDHHDRSKAQSYNVTTISLVDMLAKYSAPAVIDYVSIDTEGSELEILKNVDFDRYTFRALTVEHNFVKDQQQCIFELLTSKGYMRVLPDLTQFDDWYVHRSTLLESV